MKVRVKHVSPRKTVWISDKVEGNINKKIILLNKKRIQKVNKYVCQQKTMVNELSQKIERAYTKIGKMKSKFTKLKEQRNKLGIKEVDLHQRSVLIREKENKYEHDKDKWIKDHMPLCIACEENPRECKFSGCAHVVFCKECMSKAKNFCSNFYKCPICSTESRYTFDLIYS